MLLAIDTSTQTSSIALYDERGVLGEVTWRTRENHTRSLMPEIVRLMDLVGTNVNELRAIGVATGPGSFTGLRIGLSAAKGLAFSLNAALVGVPTLEVCASACATQNVPTCAVMRAGRERFGAALYENEKGVAQRVSDHFFGDAPQLATQLRAPFEKYETVFVMGEIDAGLREPLSVEFSGRVIFANDALNVRRAGFLAALAWQRWHAGAVDDLQTLAPFYIPTLSLA